jgi:acyl-CoA synthetase (AMP-forming)/AMP-acid ligase II
MLLEMAADGSDGRIAVGSRDTGISAAELLVRARRVARVFTEREARRVGFVGLNSDAVPLALFGAAIAGLPFAPVSYRLTDAQLTATLERVAPAVVVIDDDMTGRVDAAEGIDVLTRAQVLDAARDGDGLEGAFVDPDEVAILLFTSGTTGGPKAAVLRHRHLTSYILNSVEFLGAEPTDAQLVSVPSYHIAGVSAVLSCVYGGRRIVYLPDFDAASWLAAVVTEQITHAMVVPTMLGRVLRVVEDERVSLPSLRHISYGGGRMPLELIERAMTLLPEVDFVNAYGLTETSSTITVLAPDDHRLAMASSDPAVHRRLTSVGRALPSVELEIRAPDGSPCAAGDVGEICVRGEQVAGEYLGASALTDDGWFRTNDAGSLDPDGYLYLDGRLDDVIVRGAENISPGEIEDTLTSHPAVAEAAVVGVPDPEWGEAVAAAVVLEDGADVTEEELRDWVRERLRSTKTPERIQLRDELPYNETGKLLRRVLRDELSGPE